MGYETPRLRDSGTPQIARKRNRPLDNPNLGATFAIARPDENHELHRLSPELGTRYSVLGTELTTTRHETDLPNDCPNSP